MRRFMVPVALAYLALASQWCMCDTTSGSDPKEEEQSIGFAVSYTRNLAEAVITDKNAFLGVPATRRILQDGGCSDSDNSVYAVRIRVNGSLTVHSKKFKIKSIVRYPAG